MKLAHCKSTNVNVIALRGYCKTWKKAFFFYSDLVRGPLIFFLSFFPPHGFSESCSSSFRHRSSFTTSGFVCGEGAERSWLRYPTETLCVGALPSCIFTLLASFHTITTQCHPHSHGNVKTSSPHVWVSTGRICVKRRVKRCWETVRRRIQKHWRQQRGEEAVKDRQGSKCYVPAFTRYLNALISYSK